MSRHPLLGLWIVMVADPSVDVGRAALVGRTEDALYVLGFRDVGRARACAAEAGGGDVVLVVQANLQPIVDALVQQKVTGIVVDWVPGQPTIEEAHSLA